MPPKDPEAIDRLTKSHLDWRRLLTPEQYRSRRRVFADAPDERVLVLHPARGRMTLVTRRAV